MICNQNDRKFNFLKNGFKIIFRILVVFILGSMLAHDKFDGLVVFFCLAVKIGEDVTWLFRIKQNIKFDSGNDAFN